MAPAPSRRGPAWPPSPPAVASRAALSCKPLPLSELLLLSSSIPPSAAVGDDEPGLELTVHAKSAHEKVRAAARWTRAFIELPFPSETLLRGNIEVHLDSPSGTMIGQWFAFRS